MSLATQVLIGLGLGVAVGLFFGEWVGFLGVAGTVFIQLLQMTVLPYVVVSLIAGLGRLNFAQARSLAWSGGLVLLMMWGLVLVMVVAAPLAFPQRETASFFSRAMVQEPPSVNFMELYIPANPFFSLSNTLVPAVVLFSIAVGVALIGVKEKESLIRTLDVLAETLMRITQFVARLAPYGVFAIAASTAGTMSVKEFGRMQVYLITQALVALLLVLWILPALVQSLTPIRYRQLFDRTRGALLTAFATGNLLIVLPMLAHESKEILQEAESADESLLSSPDILVPASFNFPNMGKLLSLLFVPFAAWFIGRPLAATAYPSLLTTGLASFFGEVVVAMPFLLNLNQIPSDLFQLFVAGDVIGGRLGTLLAAMHTLVFTLLGAYVMTGRVRVRWGRLTRLATVTLGLVALTLGGARLFFSATLHEKYTKDEVLAGMQTLQKPVFAIVHTNPPTHALPMLDTEQTRLAQIRRRGVLRVGYMPDNLPYSYFNSAGDLVGFDVEMAYALGRDLKVRLEFVPVQSDRLAEQLRSGYCDIVMSGVAMTTGQAARMKFSRPYLEVTPAFLTRDYRVGDFGSLAALHRLKSPRIGAGYRPYYLAKLKQWIPDARIVPVETGTDVGRILASDREEVDAILMSAEEASAWSVLYPAYSVAIPKPILLSVPLAYPLDYRAEELADLVNTWLTLKRHDQTISRIYDHWILGKTLAQREPRWSIIRNVLGWVD